MRGTEQGQLARSERPAPYHRVSFSPALFAFAPGCARSFHARSAGKPRFDLIGETFVRDPDRPFVQMGLRYSLIQDKAQIDSTTGRRIGAQGNERRVAVGLRMLAPRWRP